MTDQEFLDRLKALRETRAAALRAAHEKKLAYARLKDEARKLVPGLTIGVLKRPADQLGYFQFQGQLGAVTYDYGDPDFESDFTAANRELNELCVTYLMDLESPNRCA